MASMAALTAAPPSAPPAATAAARASVPPPAARRGCPLWSASHRRESSPWSGTFPRAVGQQQHAAGRGEDGQYVE